MIDLHMHPGVSVDASAGRGLRPQLMADLQMAGDEFPVRLTFEFEGNDSMQFRLSIEEADALKSKLGQAICQAKRGA